MPTPGDTAAPSLPSTCRVLNWVVFGPGMHKDELYSPERCKQIVANFQRLSKATRHTVPRVALGHDQQQRFAKSLGFPNVGTITRCVLVPGYEDQGYFQLDLDNVPVEVGGEINAGRLPGGSIEIKSNQRDPDDATKKVPGDVLTGVALLGDEQPCCRTFPLELQERSRPRAVFADGRAVPPNESPTKWLNAMADVTRAMAQEYRGEYDEGRRTLKINGREYADRTACFSDLNNPTQRAKIMTPQQEAALAGLGFTPDQIEAMEAALGGAADATTTTAADASVAAPGAPQMPQTNPTMSDDKKPGLGDVLGFSSHWRKMADMEPDPAKKQCYAAFADEDEKKQKEFSELNKRVKEFAAFADEQQKKTEEVQMAAFSADVEAKIQKLARKVPPATREALKKRWTRDYAPTAKAFSSDADRVKAFADDFAAYAAMPDHPSLAALPGKPTKQTAPTELPDKHRQSLALTQMGREMLAEMDRKAAAAK